MACLKNKLNTVGGRLTPRYAFVTYRLPATAGGPAKIPLPATAGAAANFRPISANTGCKWEPGPCSSPQVSRHMHGTHSPSTSESAAEPHPGPLWAHQHCNGCMLCSLFWLWSGARGCNSRGGGAFAEAGPMAATKLHTAAIDAKADKGWPPHSKPTTDTRPFPTAAVPKD